METFQQSVIVVMLYRVRFWMNFKTGAQTSKNVSPLPPSFVAYHAG